MALISPLGGFNAFSGSIDPTAEGMVSALEGTTFAPNPFAQAAAFGPDPSISLSLAISGGGGFGPSPYQVGPNPMMQILPLLLGALQGLGQGWGGIAGGGGGVGNPGFAPQAPQQGGGCH